MIIIFFILNSDQLLQRKRSVANFNSVSSYTEAFNLLTVWLFILSVLGKKQLSFFTALCNDFMAKVIKSMLYPLLYNALTSCMKLTKAEHLLYHFMPESSFVLSQYSVSICRFKFCLVFSGSHSSVCVCLF